MATFAWSDSYSVRVQQLDAQHKKLFDTINSLADAMRMGKGADAIRGVVQQLVVYTRTHFQQEEALMRQTGYPGLAAHQQQHAQLLADVGKYQREIETGQAPNSVAVLSFLQKWLVGHIQQSDKRYAEHMNANGVR